MDPESYVNASLLSRATATERRFFEGLQSSSMASLVQDFAVSEGMREPHMEFFLGLNRDFRTATGLINIGSTNSFRFEGGVLVPGSIAQSHDWAVCPQDQAGKTFWAMNSYLSTAMPEGIFFCAREFPVKWHLDHINERCKQRRSSPIEPYSMDFVRHNAVALSMLRIFEEQHRKTGNSYYSFALPEKNGLLYGHTMNIASPEITNRLHLLATNRFGNFPTAPYSWRPNLCMTVRTFIGPDEMTPAQAKLRMELLRFYQPDKARALANELSFFNNVHGGYVHVAPGIMKTYEACTEAMKRLMTSPLWYATTRLPAHLRTMDFSKE